MHKSRLLKASLVMLTIPLLAFGQARSVKILRIDVTGKVNATDLKKIALCRTFKPTLQQAKHFSTRADYIPKATVTAERDAACYATGSLIYSDNSHATWTLYSNGSATLLLTR